MSAQILVICLTLGVPVTKPLSGFVYFNNTSLHGLPLNLSRPHVKAKQKLALLFLVYLETSLHAILSTVDTIHNQMYNGTYSASQNQDVAPLPQRRTAFAITKRNSDQVRSHSHKITNTEKHSQEHAEERSQSCSEAGHHGKYPAGRFVCSHPRRAGAVLTSARSY